MVHERYSPDKMSGCMQHLLFPSGLSCLLSVVQRMAGTVKAQPLSFDRDVFAIFKFAANDAILLLTLVTARPILQNLHSKSEVVQGECC